MKKYFTFYLFLALQSALFAQQNAPLSLYDQPKQAWRAKLANSARNYIRLSAGMALPQGTFASVYAKEQAGYAQIGWAASLDVGVHLSRNIGIGSTFGVYNNTLNQRAYLFNLKKQLPQSTAAVPLQPANWWNIMIAAGPILTLPEKKFVFDLGFFVGTCLGASPDISYVSNDEKGSVVFRQVAKNAVGAAMLIHTSVSVPIDAYNQWSVFAKGDLTAAALKYQTVQQLDSDLYAANARYHFRQSVGSFNFCIGISKQLGYAPNRRQLFNH